MKIKIEIKEEHFISLADDIGISPHDLQKLHTLGFLQENKILGYLIKSDFKKLKQKRYRTQHIVSRLSLKYHVTNNKVLSAIYDKRQTVYYCEECGLVISRSKYKNNGGLCDNCFAKTIEI